MDIVDTHCHIHEALTSPLNDATHDKWAAAGKLDPDQIISDARAAGVTQLICVGTDVDDSQLAVKFVQSRPSAWASIGIHPHEAKRFVDDATELKRFEALASEPKVVAVGECGLDYFYTHSPKADQERILRFQMELAIRHDLPMIFHVREAFGDFWPIFDEYSGKGNKSGKNGQGNIRGVIHSFSATRRELDASLERGLFIGVNGIATFAKDPAQLAAYAAIPADRMVIETDAPYLTPTPYRGTICESKHATTTLTFVATNIGYIQGDPKSSREQQIEMLAAQTTANARQLFNLPQHD